MDYYLNFYTAGNSAFIPPNLHKHIARFRVLYRSFGKHLYRSTSCFRWRGLTCQSVCGRKVVIHIRSPWPGIRFAQALGTRSFLTSARFSLQPMPRQPLILFCSPAQSQNASHRVRGGGPANPTTPIQHQHPVFVSRHTRQPLGAPPAWTFCSARSHLRYSLRWLETARFSIYNLESD